VFRRHGRRATGCRTGARWYIVTIFWWNETTATPIPGRYLTSENH
jgi:hypothetical protein